MFPDHNQSVGWPDLSQPSMIDDILRNVCGVKLPTRADQARRWAREAMEALCGVERCALACAPAVTLSAGDVEAMAAADPQELAQEARVRQRPVNFHD